MLLEVEAKRAYHAHNTKSKKSYSARSTGSRLRSILSQLIKYVQDGKRSVQREVAMELRQAQNAQAFYVKNRIRIQREDRNFGRRRSRANSAASSCQRREITGRNAHAKAARNAKASHKSFQNYKRDLNYERAALRRVMSILRGNHRSTAAAERLADSRKLRRR